MWKLSRYWNRAVYKLIDFAVFLLWDQSKGNEDLIRDFNSDVLREILTSIPK